MNAPVSPKSPRAPSSRRLKLPAFLNRPRALARYVRDRLKLAAAPRRSFDTASLRPADMDPVRAAFDDPQITARFAADQDLISGHYPAVSLAGGVNIGDRRAIYALVAAWKPETLLEVGTHVGSSTLYIARALETVSPTARMTTVDIYDVNRPDGAWARVGLPMSPRDYTHAIDSAERVEFKVAPALSFLESTQERFDFIFLDGDHEAAAVYREVSAALAILRPGGVILLHDYYPDGRPLFSSGTTIYGPYLAMKRATREQPGLRVFPLGALPWPTKLGSHTTSLALVMRSPTA